MSGQFSVLGPLAVTGPAGAVDVRGQRERAVLVRLLLDAGRSVPVATLVTDLWPADHPSAGRSLQVRVSALRRALAGVARIELVGGGYRIAVPADAVDAHRFERACAAAARQDGPAAIAAGREALGLWRGHPLADLADSPCAHLSVRYQRLHDQVREDLGEALTASGQAAEAITVLTALVDEAPLQESAVVALVRALYADGRSADALAAHRAALDRLAEEGLDPHPWLRDLDTAILRHDLPVPAPPVVPVAASRQPQTPRHGLGPLIGRRADVDLARATLLQDGTRLLTLWGPGGVGKSRLAMALTEELRDAHPEPPVVVEAACLDHVDDLAPAIAAGAGSRQAYGTSGNLADIFAGRRLLLVLDNLEHLDGSADLIDDLLATTQELQLLVTSRRVLGLRSERVQRVEPLPVTTPDAPERSEVTAVEFLLRRAADMGVTGLDQADEGVLAALAGRLDGLPLALELAAARLRMMSPSTLLERLTAHTNALGNLRDLPPRQRSLRAVLEWSVALLDQDAETTLRRLGAFAGPAPLDAIEHVVDRDGVLEELAELVDHSLVQSVDRPGGSRTFTLMETVRRWARTQLQLHDPDGRTAQRHADWFREKARQAAGGLLSDQQGRWLHELNEAESELDRALRHLSTTQRHGELRAMVLDLERWWLGMGAWCTARDWLTTVAARPITDPTERARVLRAHATMLLSLGEPEGCELLVTQAKDAAAASDDPRAAAEAASAEGRLQLGRGEFASAADCLLRAAALWEEVGQPLLGAEKLLQAGLAVGRGGDMARCEELNLQALNVFLRHGATWELASVRNNLAHLANARGDTETALLQIRASLAVSEQLDARSAVWPALDTLARIQRRRGELDEARAAAEQGAALAHRGGDGVGRDFLRLELVTIELARGAPQEALRQLVELDLEQVASSLRWHLLAEAAQVMAALGERPAALHLAAMAATQEPDISQLEEGRWTALLSTFEDDAWFEASAEAAALSWAEVVADYQSRRAAWLARDSWQPAEHQQGAGQGTGGAAAAGAGPPRSHHG